MSVIFCAGFSFGLAFSYFHEKYYEGALGMAAWGTFCLICHYIH
jgi:hypothetical protein